MNTGGLRPAPPPQNLDSPPYTRCRKAISHAELWGVPAPRTGTLYCNRNPGWDKKAGGQSKRPRRGVNLSRTSFCGEGPRLCVRSTLDTPRPEGVKGQVTWNILPGRSHCRTQEPALAWSKTASEDRRLATWLLKGKGAEGGVGGCSIGNPWGTQGGLT